MGFGTSLKWYDYKWLVITLLLVFFPIGLYALAKSKAFERITKILTFSFIMTVFGLFFGMVFYNIYKSKTAGFNHYSEYAEAKKLGIDNANDYQLYKEKIDLLRKQQAVELEIEKIRADKRQAALNYVDELTTFHGAIAYSLIKNLQILKDAFNSHEKRSFWEDDFASKWRDNYVEITHLLLELSDDERMKQLDKMPTKDILIDIKKRLNNDGDLDQIFKDIESYDYQIKPFEAYAKKLEAGLLKLEELIGFPPDRIIEYY